MRSLYKILLASLVIIVVTTVLRLNITPGYFQKQYCYWDTIQDRPRERGIEIYSKQIRIYSPELRLDPDECEQKPIDYVISFAAQSLNYFDADYLLHLGGAQPRNYYFYYLIPPYPLLFFMFVGLIMLAITNIKNRGTKIFTLFFLSGLFLLMNFQRPLIFFIITAITVTAIKITKDTLFRSFIFTIFALFFLLNLIPGHFHINCCGEVKYWDDKGTERCAFKCRHYTPQYHPLYLFFIVGDVFDMDLLAKPNPYAPER